MNVNNVNIYHHKLLKLIIERNIYISIVHIGTYLVFVI